MQKRIVYDVSMMLGDVGGLFDGLKLLFEFLLGPFITFALNAEILNHAFLLLNKKKSKRTGVQKRLFMLEKASKIPE